MEAILGTYQNFLTWYIEKAKEFLIEYKKVLQVSIILIALFTVILTGVINHYTIKIQDLKNQNIQLNMALDIANTKNSVKISAIYSMVEPLAKFLKRLYPSYDYKAKIDEAFNDQDKIANLPTDLFKLYTDEYLLKPHGLKNYQKTLPNVLSPMVEETSFVSCKDGEFGTKRGYSLYRYQHEGNDILNYEDMRVFVPYDGFIWKKYFTKESGWCIEIKFYYKDAEGNKGWYFVRYMHLDAVDNIVKGQSVIRGEVIGSMSDTGIFAAKKHLHVELWKFNKQKNKYILINFYQNNTWGNAYKDTLIY